jgi:hypothetical protein
MFWLMERALRAAKRGRHCQKGKVAQIWQLYGNQILSDYWGLLERGERHGIKQKSAPTFYIVVGNRCHNFLDIWFHAKNAQRRRKRRGRLYDQM